MMGPTWMRVRLTLGSDCLPALFQWTILPLCFLHCLLVRVRCQMIQGCTSMSPPLLSICVCAPGAILLGHVHIHLHGSWYLMMDYVSCVYYRLLTPCLLMFHGVHYNSFTTSY